MSATAFGGLENEGVAGDLTLTVTPLPVLHFSVGLGQIAVDWDQARCQQLRGDKGLDGQGGTRRHRADDQRSGLLPGAATVVSRTGRWDGHIERIRPRQLAQAYVTTPWLDPIFDPKFSLSYDVKAGLSINLPQTLDASTRLRISDPNLVINNVLLDSHNLTADIIKTTVSWFGGAQYFQPASIALTPYLSSAVNDANAALANLDAAFQQAAATGFTRIDVSLDPATLSLNITLT